MTELAQPKETLQRYLQMAREALLWKLEGLSEYDARRPMTPTGTNVLGVIKHVASVELGYLGDVFDRPSGIPMPWFEPDAEPNADMWATAEESREDVVDLYHRAWVHADLTIAELPLDAIGSVPWWGPANQVSLHQILIHVIAETNRHAGHVDIVRELIDGSAGLREAGTNLPPDADEAWWLAYRERLEAVANKSGDRGR